MGQSLKALLRHRTQKRISDEICHDAACLGVWRLRLGMTFLVLILTLIRLAVFYRAANIERMLPGDGAPLTALVLRVDNFTGAQSKLAAGNNNTGRMVVAIVPPQGGRAFPTALSVDLLRACFWGERRLVSGKIPEGTAAGDCLFLSLSDQSFERARNPGGFDEKEYWNRLGVLGKSETRRAIARPYSADRPFLLLLPRRWGNALRDQLSASLHREMGDRYGGLAAAMLLGDDRYLPKEQKDAFRRSGLMHLLVVSGGNVGLLMGLLAPLIGRVTRKHALRKGLGMAVLLVFGCITSWDASVCRAVLSVLFHLTAQVLKRPAKPTLILQNTVLLLLTINPFLLLNLGFVMSVSITYVIFRLAPTWSKACADRLFHWECELSLAVDNRCARGCACERLLLGAERLGEGILWVSRRLAPLICLITAAQFGSLPFSLFLHAKIGLGQWLANLLAAPVAAFISLNGYLMLPFLACPIAARFARLYFVQALAILDDLARLAASWRPLFLLTLERGALLVPLSVFLLYPNEKRRDKGRSAPDPQRASRQDAKTLLSGRGGATLLAALLCLIFLHLRWLTLPDYQTYFFDIGQGCSVFLQAKEGGAVLYDTGKAERTPDMLRALDALGVDCLDVLILSHLDEDHCGGTAMVLSEKRVKAVLLPDTRDAADEDERKKIENMRGICQKYQVQTRSATRGARLEIRGLLLEILNSSHEGHSIGNQGSYVVRVNFGSGNILLTGDCGERIWRQAVTADTLHESRIVLTPHHGAKGGMPTQFPDFMYQKAFIIQCGYRNPYGHPHADVLNSLLESHALVYRSDIDGCCTLRVKGLAWRLHSMATDRETLWRTGDG